MLNKIKNFLFNNTSLSQTIAKNTFWLFAGQIASRLLRAAIVIYAARVLGAASWGAFSYALGVAAFLTIFSDIGINALITKEATRNPQLKDQYLATAFFVKLALLTVIVLGVLAFFPYLTNIPEAAAIMPILIFVFAFDTLRDLGSALARALERMQIEALVNIFTNAAIVALGFIFLYVGRSSTALALAYAGGSGLGLIAIAVTLKGHLRHLTRHFTPSLVKPIFATAWPFGMMGIMGAVMLNTDIIMLGWLRTPAEVGFYSAAQKLILLAYVLPQLVASGIFPALARLAATEKAHAKELLETGTAWLLLAAAPLVLGGLVLAPYIIGLVFGSEYIAAVPTFKILLFTLLIVYPSTLIGNAVFAYDAQKSFVGFVLVAVFGNAFFNLLLIPPLGIEGAALGTLITQLLTNVFIWRKMRELSGFRLAPALRAATLKILGR